MVERYNKRSAYPLSLILNAAIKADLMAQWPLWALRVIRDCDPEQFATFKALRINAIYGKFSVSK